MRRYHRGIFVAAALAATPNDPPEGRDRNSSRRNPAQALVSRRGEDARYPRNQRVDVEGFDDEVVRPEGRRRFGDVAAGEGRHHDDGFLEAVGAESSEDVQSGTVGKSEIEEHEIEPIDGILKNPADRVALHDRKAVRRQFGDERPSQKMFIVDDQDGRLLITHDVPFIHPRSAGISALANENDEVFSVPQSMCRAPCDSGIDRRNDGFFTVSPLKE